MKLKHVIGLCMVIVLTFASVAVGIVFWRGTSDLDTLEPKTGEGVAYVSMKGAKWAEFYHTPTTTIIFHGDDDIEIGRLEWGTGKFVFVGKAEESALVFFEHFVKALVDEYIGKELEKEENKMARVCPKCGKEGERRTGWSEHVATSHGTIEVAWWGCLDGHRWMMEVPPNVIGKECP